MATPTLRLVRQALPGSFVGALVRPAVREVLDGLDSVDELHVAHPTGVLGPKRVGFGLRARRYEAALLLTNSFSTALIARVAGIPRRVGYDRDGRGMLLTERLHAPELEGSRAGRRRWAPVTAVEYYLRAARAFLGEDDGDASAQAHDCALELATSERDEAKAGELLAGAGIGEGEAYGIVNPGGNDARKRWPADRFGEIAAWLARERGMRVLVNGSPGEAEIVRAVVEGAGEEARAASLVELGVTLAALKAVIRRASLVVTNDTGPRHIAAAFGTPCVALFGPTDPRWTTLPAGVPEVRVLADPTLGEDEVADEHAERCRMDRIEVGRVMGAIERAMWL